MKDTKGQGKPRPSLVRRSSELWDKWASGTSDAGTEEKHNAKFSKGEDKVETVAKKVLFDRGEEKIICTEGNVKVVPAVKRFGSGNFRADPIRSDDSTACTRNL